LELIKIEQVPILRLRSPTLPLFEELVDPLALGGGDGDAKPPSLLPAAVDALLLDDLRDVVHRLLAQTFRLTHELSTMLAGVDTRVTGDTPPTVPPLRPEAPKPAISRSSTATSSSGARVFT
jgi:hypothetical protein